MIISSLHKLDLQLCDYVWSNILYRSDEKRFMSVLREEMNSGLLDYLLNEDEGYGNQQPLLNNDELFELASAVDGMTDRFVLTWEPYEQLHRRDVYSVAEVRDNLSPTSAEKWAAVCNEFALELEQDNLPLVDGIEIVTDWIFELRRLLSAIGRTDLIPAPEGTFLSATNALPRETPSSSEAVPEQDHKDLQPANKDQIQKQRVNKSEEEGNENSGSSLENEPYLGIHLDYKSSKITRDGFESTNDVDLTPIQIRLTDILLEASGNVVAFEAIKSAWKDGRVTRGNMSSTVNKLNLRLTKLKLVVEGQNNIGYFLAEKNEPS